MPSSRGFSPPRDLNLVSTGRQVLSPKIEVWGGLGSRGAGPKAGGVRPRGDVKSPDTPRWVESCFPGTIPQKRIGSRHQLSSLPQLTLFYTLCPIQATADFVSNLRSKTLCSNLAKLRLQRYTWVVTQQGPRPSRPRGPKGRQSPACCRRWVRQ